MPDEAVVFSVEPVDLITYPWEWPNSLLEAAALLTLDLRRRLLGIGLDLKDASAFNVQFRGMHPVFIDLGSIETWRPNPSWNASRQFIEHFINPLAVGSGDRVTAADAWALARHRGLRSEAARQLLPKGRRRSLSLLLLQATTRPVEKNAPSESKYADQASRNPELAKNATLSLTKRLAKQVAKLQGREHSTTWVDYGTRGHYGSDDLTRKSDLATAFLAGGDGPQPARARRGRQRRVHRDAPRAARRRPGHRHGRRRWGPRRPSRRGLPAARGGRPGDAGPGRSHEPHPCIRTPRP